MDIDILYRQSSSLAVMRLGPHEEVRVASGSMVSMSHSVALQTQATGGLLKSLAQSTLDGEGFHSNSFRAPAAGGEVTVAPVLPGDMEVLELRDNSLLMQSGSLVAADQSLQIDTTWGGARAFFGAQGLIMLRVSGTGKLVVSAYGAIHRKDLADAEVYTVESGHLVAFGAEMGFKVRPVGRMKSLFVSGEGLVVDISGPGVALVQTRSVDAFLAWLAQRLPARRD